jgi:hypothetical protein
MICARFAGGTSQTVPPETWLFPPGGTEASSFDLSFTQGMKTAVPTHLRFDGSIQNSSFFNGAQVSFWFGWTDSDGAPHASLPEAFTLTAIMGALTSHSFELFSRDFVIPYSLAEVSVQFANETANSLDGRPVLVTGWLGIRVIVIQVSLVHKKPHGK